MLAHHVFISFISMKNWEYNLTFYLISKLRKQRPENVKLRENYSLKFLFFDINV